MTANQPDQGQQFVEWVKLADVVEADENPRDHDIPYIQSLIRRFGFLQPVVHDERTGKLVMGHGRLAALRGMLADGEDAPGNIQELEDDWALPRVRGFSSQDDDEALVLQIADNRADERSSWQPGPLFDWLSGFASDRPDLLPLVGYDSVDLDRMLAETTTVDPLAPVPEPVLDDYGDTGRERGDRADYRDDDERELDDRPEKSPLDAQPGWRTIHPLRAVFHTGGMAGAKLVEDFVGKDGGVIVELNGTTFFPKRGLRVPSGCWVTRDGQTGKLELLTYAEFVERYQAANEPAARIQRAAEAAPIPLAKPEDLGDRGPVDDGPERLATVLEGAWKRPGEIPDFTDEPLPEEDPERD